MARKIVEKGRKLKEAHARRLSSREVLDREVQACVQERNLKRRSVTWQFSVDHASQTLHLHYYNVYSNS